MARPVTVGYGPPVAIYQPPDEVLVAIGAAYPTASILVAGRRLVGLARAAEARVLPFGLDPERVEKTEEQLDSLERMAGSGRAQKHDTALQMAELVETMAEARGWMVSLRLLAGINLAADTPALLRVASPEPELREGYPRDLLAELERRLAAARDLGPRLRDAGLDRAFVSSGNRIANQLRTAIGPRDLRPSDLDLELRRLYLRKGSVFLELQRFARIGQLTAVGSPERAEGWHLDELCSVRPIPVRRESHSRAGT